MVFIKWLTSILLTQNLVGGEYRLSPLNKFDNGYPESQYNHVIDQLIKVYEPIINEQGGELIVLSDWNDGAVNMWAERWGDQYRLEIPGGMSRYYLIGEEAFIISICHELGHLLGGPPANGVISFEGQSDFFANQECSRWILESVQPWKKLKVDSEVEKFCRAADEPTLCEKVVQGSKMLTSYYAELENSLFPNISTPDLSSVQSTLATHPRAQCRLDTLLAGFLHESRPNCWFHP